MTNGTVLPCEEHQERKRRHSSPSTCSSPDGAGHSTKLCSEPASCISSSSLVFTLLPLEERIQPTCLTKGVISVSKSTNGGSTSTAVEKKKSPFYFGVEGVRIGRDPEVSDLSFPSWNGVSRLHCVISVVGFHVYIRDLSLNGTFVNGRYVGRGQSVELTEGDMIAVCNPFLPHASSYTFIFTSPSVYQKSLSQSFLSNSRIFSTFPYLFPQYSLGVVVGQGVYATVYSATDRRTGDPVAIKLLKKNHFSMDVFETAMRLEVEVLRSLQHPHIIRLLDTLTAPGLMALVMELVPGGDLFDYVVSRGKHPFTEQEARILFRQIVEAVRYMHSRNIIHCDLKPENVVIAGLPNRIHLSSSFTSFQTALPEVTDNTENKAAINQENKNSTFSPLVKEENVLSLAGAPSSFSRPSHLLTEHSPTYISANFTSKPCNLLSPPTHSLSTTAGLSVLDWQLKIIDFGVAQYFQQHAYSSHCTNNGRLSSDALSLEQDGAKKAPDGVRKGERSLRMVIPTIGTPAYAAPELIQWSSGGNHPDVCSASISTSFPTEDLASSSECPSSRKNFSSVSSGEEASAEPYIFTPSPALDMWSLGVLLYILCSGSRPKKRRMSGETLVFHKHMGGLTSSCQELLGSLLTVDPRKRMTMGELLSHRWWKEGGIYFSYLEKDEQVDEIYFPSGTSSPTSPRYNAFF